MTRTQCAGWVLLGVGLVFLVIAMAFQAWTGVDFVTLTATVSGSIVTAGLAALGKAYWDASKAKSDGGE